MAIHASRSSLFSTRLIAAAAFLAVSATSASDALAQSTLRLVPAQTPSYAPQQAAAPRQAYTRPQVILTQATSPVPGNPPLMSPPAAQPAAGQQPAPGSPPSAQQSTAGPASLIRHLTSPSERLEMIVNTSRILMLDQRIDQIQVNNPEILQPTVLSPNQVQIAAKKAGVTQINLWGANRQIFTVDVVVHGDARELEAMLQSLFPAASLKVVPANNSIFIKGYVDEPEDVNHIIRVAEEYYPKVINSITVAGVQQVLLHVKVMEVSRTKLRNMGFDWTQISGNNIIASSAAGLLTGATASSSQWRMVGDMPVLETSPPQAVTTGNQTFAFNVTQGGNAFFGILEALRRNDLLKILAEPTLTTVSGRPASFNVGGEIPILVPQSLGTVSIEYKPYGTQLDFIPIVLGNGRIRLEVRPKISEIDPSNSIILQGVTVPGLRSRVVDTGAEVQAGQTLAIAGLVQTRVEGQTRGLPFLAEIPYAGALFRRVEERVNEIELLILVTPEIVDGMDPHEVPQCGPGMRTTSPSDSELYAKGHLEVPNCCPAGENGAPAGQNPTDTRPQGGDMPGMMLEPRAQGANASGESGVVRTAFQPNRYNRRVPTNGSRTNYSGQGSPAPLPGFQGQTGYDVLR